jgi:atypical dual specificity phosphatase
MHNTDFDDDLEQTVPLLRIADYGVAFGNRVVLAEIDLTIDAPGVTVLMGPTGTGKSTLLRSIAGLNNNNPRFRTWGNVECDGEPISPDRNSLALVTQNANLLRARVGDYLAERLRDSGEHRSPSEMRKLIEKRLTAFECEDLIALLDVHTAGLGLEQQRQIAILAEVMRGPRVILIDEPTAGLDERQADKILGLVAKLGEAYGVIVILHNQKHARSWGDMIVLLAGGRIQARARPYEFTEKMGGHVASFVKSGGCNVPSPDADPKMLAEDIQPPPPLPLAARLAVRAEPEYRGPQDFRWVVPGRVGTMPKPGAVISIDHDLKALRTVGVTVLITLTKNPLPEDKLAQYGLRCIHLPIYDREPPTVSQLRMLSMRMSAMINQGDVLVVHCRAGIGRTGTVVAGWLINEGLTAQAALERIRKINPKYVQTTEQEEFLTTFENALLNTV